MATKQQWLDHLKLHAKWVEDMKEWVKKQPDGEIIIVESSTQGDPIETPPKPPPNP